MSRGWVTLLRPGPTLVEMADSTYPLKNLSDRFDQLPWDPSYPRDYEEEQ